MGSSNKKIMIVQFIKLMKKYTDYDHRLSIKEIINLYKEEYDDTICRQAISNYIKELDEIGIEILCSKSKYYYSDDNRDLIDAEVELLCHSVMSSYVIPLSYSEDLIKKLKQTQSIKYIAENKNLDFNISNIDKRENKELFLNFETISKAIDDNAYISFDYFRYNADKKLCKNRSDSYKTLPIRTVSMQNKFYLITYNEKYNSFTHYRIDKIGNVKILEKALKVIEIDPYEYTKNRLYMYGGDIETFELFTDEYILDEIIDLFGKEVKINKKDNHYVVEVKTTKEAIIFFACQYIKHVTVIKPNNIKEEIIDILKNKLDEYVD